MKEAGLLQHELAVQQVQCLQGGRRSVSPGNRLPTIRTIKDTKHLVLLLANLGHVDHPAKMFIRVLF